MFLMYRKQVTSWKRCLKSEKRRDRVFQENCDWVSYSDVRLDKGFSRNSYLFYIAVRTSQKKSHATSQMWPTTTISGKNWLMWPPDLLVGHHGMRHLSFHRATREKSGDRYRSASGFSSTPICLSWKILTFGPVAPEERGVKNTSASN